MGLLRRSTRPWARGSVVPLTSSLRLEGGVQPLWARSMSEHQRGEARLALIQNRRRAWKGGHLGNRVDSAMVLCKYTALFGERSISVGFVYTMVIVGAIVVCSYECKLVCSILAHVGFVTPPPPRLPAYDVRSTGRRLSCGLRTGFLVPPNR